MGRDRNKQQKALRMMGMNEWCYQLVRLMLASIISVMSSIAMCVSAYFVDATPFNNVDVSSNICLGILIGLFIVPYI